MISPVSRFVDRIDHQALELIEKCAIENPNASRFFSIAVAIDRVAKALFLGPVLCIERIILTGKSIKDYLSTSDQEQKKAHLVQCRDNALLIFVVGFISIPLSLIFNPIIGVYDFAQMIRNPLCAAKRAIARLDLAVYKENAPEHEIFADTAHDRFTNQLRQCKNNTELSCMHFMDTEEAKAKLIAEFKAKKMVLDREFEDYKEAKGLIAKEGRANLDAQWKKFQENLAKADPADVESMTFNPTFEDPAETAAATA